MNDWLSLDAPIAVYGLAGNPPHRGHWKCVEDLVRRGFKVAIAPSFAHAFGKDMAPFKTRVQWLSKAAVDFDASPSCFVWPIEEEIAAGKPAGSRVYSIDVLERARRDFGGAPRLAVGPDNADEAIFGLFHEAERIVSEFGLVVVPEVAGARSTMIRQGLASHELGGEALVFLVGASIAEEVSMRFKGLPVEAGVVKKSGT